MTEADHELKRVRGILRRLRISDCSHLCLRTKVFDSYCCRCSKREYACGHKACDGPVPEGCTLVEDRDDLLLLDYDYPKGLEFFVKHLWAYDVPPIKRIRVWPSRNNVHVMVELQSPMPYTDRIQLQWELGSDRGRYFLDSVKTKGLRRNVLFKPIRSELAPVVP